MYASSDDQQAVRVQAINAQLVEIRRLTREVHPARSRASPA